METLINFQASGAAVPDGYSADLGAAYSDEVGYGWVTQASAGSANPTPIEMTEFGRDRNRINDQKLDTLMHMQPFGAEPAAWEHAVENGSYDVTVSVGDPRYFDSTHVLNIEGDAVISPFEPSASEPFALGTATVEVTDGKLTVDAIGGSNTKINYIEIASETSFTLIDWSTLKPSPIRRGEAVGTVADEKLYLFGGWTNKNYYPSSRADVYDPDTNTWTRIADLPEALTHGAAAVDETIDADGTDIYIAGGYLGQPDGTGQIFATEGVWKYNVESNNWTPLPSLPQARASGGLEVLNGKLHFFGGANVNRQDEGEHWVLDLDGGTSWTSAAPLPNPRTHFGDVTYEGKIYAIGGQHDVDDDLVTQDSVHRYDPQSDTWEEVADLPMPLSHHGEGTFVMDGRIIVIGGQVEHTGKENDVIAYDPETNSWTSLTPLPVARHSGIAGNIEGEIYYTTGLPGFKSTTYKGTPA